MKNGKFEVGDRVIWPTDFKTIGVKTATVTKVAVQMGTPVCWCDNKHSAEDTYYQSFMWPASCTSELTDILIKRAALKKALDESMKDVYELKNRISRGEFK